MKKRLNILCVIIILALFYAVIVTGYYMGAAAVAGFKAGYAEAEQADSTATEVSPMGKNLGDMKQVFMFPDLSQPIQETLFKDSVYNEKSGTYTPVIHTSMFVSVDTDTAVWKLVLCSCLGLICFVLGVWALIVFIRLIISINKSDIFSWRNVRRLRLLGILLVAGFGCSFLSNYLTFSDVNAHFALQGYDLIFLESVEITTFVLGICALIVGEVFAIGLKLKEEQDLTI